MSIKMINFMNHTKEIVENLERLQKYIPRDYNEPISSLDHIDEYFTNIQKLYHKEIFICDRKDDSFHFHISTNKTTLAFAKNEDDFVMFIPKYNKSSSICHFKLTNKIWLSKYNLTEIQITIEDDNKSQRNIVEFLKDLDLDIPVNPMKWTEEDINLLRFVI